MEKYDVIIVGAGPAGIFSAFELSRVNDLRVLIIEKGKDIGKRNCPVVEGGACRRCKPCDLLSGWGGAGAFSDGKLTLSPGVGGWLDEIIGEEELKRIIQYVDEIFLQFGAPEEVYGGDEAVFREWQRKANLAEMQLLPNKIRHIGTEKAREILKDMRGALKSVEVVTGENVSRLLVEDGLIKGVETDKGKRYYSDFVIVAPGRQGAEWLVAECKRIGVPVRTNPVDVGVRVEVPAVLMEPLTSSLYEPKLVFYSKSFDDKVRTFCVCPHGEVVKEFSNGVAIVNGHSYADRQTENTNFAILISTAFTEPFKDPIGYGKYIAALANMLADGIMVQRLGDLESGRRSTKERIGRGIVSPTLKDATPGDLSFVLPYRYITDILEMLYALDRLLPGIASRHTLLYGVEVKFYSSRLALSPKLETPIKNLFAIGDGAGITRSLVQAAVSGVIAGREIVYRIKKGETGRFPSASL
ncbi:NAD(P)/FAD-dependent oxidoreductase [bacterium]|nr:NAD(P)/FAD-dependent oxidoreductase [bacterium]